jgi:hypothetical protein
MVSETLEKEIGFRTTFKKETGKEFSQYPDSMELLVIIL